MRKHIMPTSSQLIQSINDRDLAVKATVKKLYPDDPPYIVRCKQCHKKYHVPMGPILTVKKVICECGQHVMTLAPNNYTPPSLHIDKIPSEPIEEIREQDMCFEL